MENVRRSCIPWSGVDENGNIHGLEGNSLAVGEDGNIEYAQFGPSIAVGDLDGDGKPDLVLADTKGFFWYFANSGTLNIAVFTKGEVMPIWLGEPVIAGDKEGADCIVPRIQLVDLDGNGKLDLIVGTYSGKLRHEKFSVRNFCCNNTVYRFFYLLCPVGR